MAVMLVTVRVLLSLYEIPSSALGPELTLDYDQRTSLMSSRFFFGTLGGAGMSVLALQVFLRKDATHPLGLLNRAGYQRNSAGREHRDFLVDHDLMRGHSSLHRRPWSMSREYGPHGGRSSRELSGTLTNRSFLALTISGIIGAISNRPEAGTRFLHLGVFL